MHCSAFLSFHVQVYYYKLLSNLISDTLKFCRVFSFLGQEARRRRLREEEVGIGRHCYRRLSSLVATAARKEDKLKLAEGGRKKNGNKRHRVGGEFERWTPRCWRYHSLFQSDFWLRYWKATKQWRVHINIRQASTGDLICSFCFLLENLNTFNLWARWLGGRAASMMDSGRQQRPQGFEETASTAEPVIQGGICFVGKFSATLPGKGCKNCIGLCSSGACPHDKTESPWVP